ncbi:MAG: hypothetical protein JSR45_12090 [Proteobacteria bacterium]|nr:hypothetical protein [Pseudomonadota bacterium]
MLRTLAVIAVILGLVSPAAAAEPAPVKVMVFASAHFANQSLDRHNVKVDDVLTSRRQAEVAALAEALAHFKPTKIALELESDEADLSLPGYQRFSDSDLQKDRREQVQLGFRIARKLGLATVYGVDEKAHPGGYDYFPIGPVMAWGHSHAQGAASLAKADAAVVAMVDQMNALQANHSLLQLSAMANQPAEIERLHREAYYRMLSLGDAQGQPGAILNGMWYLRNARIFAKVEQISRPGDRVLVIFGGGHAYWLRHFARETPGFALVEPNTVLK